MAGGNSLGVIWSPRAIRDLIGIDQYISQFAPMASQRFTASLVAAVNSLDDNPHRGRPVRSGVREMTIVRPYLVRYRVTRDAVEILRIKHGAQHPD